MVALARWSLQGLPQALGVIILFGGLGMLIGPLFHCLGGAIALLYALQRGLRPAIQLVALAMGWFVLIDWLVFGGLGQASLLAALTWLPMPLLALAIHRGDALQHGLYAASALAALVVVMVFVILGDPAPWWEKMLTAQLQGAPFHKLWQELKTDPASLAALVAPWLSGVLAACWSVLLALSALLARAWQAGLMRPGFFRTEFLGLHNGVVLTVLLGLCALLGMVSPFFLTLCGPLAALFFYQGLAVVHAMAALLRSGGVWLALFYILLIFMLPQVVIVLIMLGCLDNFVGFRKRAGHQQANKPDNPGP